MEYITLPLGRPVQVTIRGWRDVARLPVRHPDGHPDRMTGRVDSPSGWRVGGRVAIRMAIPDDEAKLALPLSASSSELAIPDEKNLAIQQG